MVHRYALLCIAVAVSSILLLPPLSALASSGMVGPAFAIGGSEVFGPASRDQDSPALAFDGENYLIVWADRQTGWDNPRVRGARLTQSGSLIDSVGFTVSEENPNVNYEMPAIAFDGANYLVVWSEQFSWGDGDIVAARVTPFGQILDRTRVSSFGADGPKWYPSVAFDGTNYLVVWADYRSGQLEIYGARVSTSGTVLDPDGITISAGPGERRYPEVTFGGTNFFVVWSSSLSDIYGARVAPSGTVLDPAGIPIATGSHREDDPAVSFDGTNYFVVWENWDAGQTDTDIFGTRVNSLGVVLDPGGVPISTGDEFQARSCISFDGSNYLVIWTGDLNGVYATRVTPSATVLDPSAIVISNLDTQYDGPAVVYGPDHFLVTWMDNRHGPGDIYAARVEGSGAVLDPLAFIVSMGVSTQGLPAAASDTTNYFVVWQGNEAGREEPFWALVNPCGVLLDSSSLRVGIGWYMDCTDPAIAYDGSNFLVVWAETWWGGIMGARVTPEGYLLDPNGIAITGTLSEDARSPAVAFDGTNYLVVWQDYRNGDWDIYGARVSPTTGGVLEPDGIVIATVDYTDEVAPNVAFDGTNYVAVWNRPIAGGWVVFGARIQPSGTVVDKNGVRVSYYEDVVTPQIDPAIAFDGTNYLLVWFDEPEWGEIGGITGVRLNKSLAQLDIAGIGISYPYEQASHADVAFDGTNYLVVWGDLRNGVSSDIYGARVSVGGAVLDADGIQISTADGDQRSPAVCRGPSGSAIITYESPALDGHGTYRIWGNMWQGPTAVAFASVGATVADGGVTLSWRVTTDVPASSFTMERSDSRDGEILSLDCPIVKGSASSFSCTDRSVSFGQTYWYTIVLGGVGTAESYGPLEVYVSPDALVYRAHEGYPNPFNPQCTIQFQLPEATHVTLRIFDVTGTLVRTLVDEDRQPGFYSEVWNGRSESGRRLASGAYFYQLEARSFTAVRKIVLLR